MVIINLLNILETKKDGGKLIHRLEKMKGKAAAILSKIPKTFPEYTPHDIHHKERILSRLNQIIPKSLAEDFNQYEIYFLIAATYLHDIGMADIPELLRGTGIRRKNFKELQNHIRTTHQERSEKYILNHFREFAIEDIHQAEIIGVIARGHRKENLYDRDMFEPGKMYKQYAINIPLLAALLKIGDELDLTFERTPMTIYEHVSPRDKISQLEWKKHIFTSGVGIDIDDPLSIKCNATCYNPKIHRLLKEMEHKINNQLDELPNHLYNYRNHSKELPRKFKLNIKTQNYIAHDLKFTLQEKEIIKILLGEKLYKRKEEGLRELLKNSVDACRLRKELLKKSGMSFKPQIIFEMSPNTNKITISDNGTGMDEETIERYFTKIGRSFYKSSEFLDQELDFTPVSELGIGILSCFMLADKIEIETKTESDDPIVLSIDDVSEYFFIKKGTREDTGTSVTLFLKDEFKKQIKLHEEIIRYASHIEFPIKVIEEKKISTIEDRGYKPRWNEFSNVWKAGLATSYDIKINEPYLEGVISILGGKDKKLGWVPLDNQVLSDYKEDWHTDKRFSISIEGIYVNSNYLIEWIRDHYIFMNLNIKGNIVDLNVARNEFIENDKFKNFITHIEKLFFKGMADIFSTFKPQGKKEGILFRTFFSHLYNDYMHYSVKNAELSDQVVDFFKKFHEYTCITKRGIEHLTYNQMIKRGKQIEWLLGFQPDTTEEHFQFLRNNIGELKRDKIFVVSARGVHGTVSHYIFEVFNILKGKNIFDFLKLQKSNELKMLLSKINVSLVRFKNIKTEKFILYYNYPDIYSPEKKYIKPKFSDTLLNRDNKFVQLLIQHQKLIKGDKKMAFESFLKLIEYFPLHLKYDEVMRQQKEILKWFINAKIIEKNDLTKYLLQRSDFSVYLD